MCKNQDAGIEEKNQEAKKSRSKERIQKKNKYQRKPKLKISKTR
jgi:hypothetical protein